MLNSIILMGRLTKEPELRKSSNGENSICNFDLAVDNIRKDAKGEKTTSFFKVVSFSGVADNIVKHLHKGSRVAVEGSIEQRNFLRQDGSKGSVYEVIASSVEFLDPKPEEPSEPDLDDVPLDSCGSLDGEKYVDEKGEEKEIKYDPYTGKPLKPTQKK